MDAIDHALTAAWLALLERIERDQGAAAELARRRARAERIRARPVRPWCIALRAGDRRIDEWGLSWTPDDDAQNGRPHEVRLTQWDLVDLTRPIDLGPWPGVRVSEAARLLGRTHSTVLNWARTGALRHEVYDRRVFGLGGTFGGPMLSVWAPSRLIDPNAERARPPHRMWGTLWQHLAKHVPAEWQCTLQRVPVVSPLGGVHWGWLCPGRGGMANGQMANGQMASGEGRTPSDSLRESPPPRGAGEGGTPSDPLRGSPPPRGAGEGGCGRVVRKVYLPLPCWTVADYRGELEKLGIPLPAWANLMGQSLMCWKCWGIQAKRLTDGAGWNLFVSHVTGGLLTGREVPRPEADAPLEAPRSVWRIGWTERTSERRARVRRMLLEGESYREIAAALGVSWTIVMLDAKAIYRAAGCRGRRGGTRWELARRLEWGGAAEGAALARLERLDLTPRQREVARLLVRGWSMREIGEELGIKAKSANERAYQVYRRLGIHGRAELRALVGVGSAGAVEGEEGRTAAAAG